VNEVHRNDEGARSLPERYVLLCLRVGRHIDGFIDAYFGPPEWKELVDGESPTEPHVLREEALALIEALPSADLEPQRTRWLRGQLRALECTLAPLTGEEVAWADEVERCIGVRPAKTDTAVFEDVHRRLDTALAGSGTVRERFIAWEERNAIAPENLIPALEKLKDALGPRAHELAPMPATESVSYEIVSDKPWIAYNWYQGRYLSIVQVNADLPISIALLTDLAAHEAYPGHHTERAAKEAHLIEELGRVETSVAIISGPEALVSEGIAMNALEQALGPDPYDVVAELLGPLGVSFDAAEVHEVHQAEIAFFGASVNAAFMLHEDGATTEEAEEYLRTWALESDKKAARTVAFLTEPSSRAYVPAYPEGQRLCRAFASRAPGNFTRLLTEQLTTADLVGEPVTA
jgi:hypothetical protein